jgi:hypothetical protein
MLQIGPQAGLHITSDDWRSVYSRSAARMHPARHARERRALGPHTVHVRPLRVSSFAPTDAVSRQAGGPPGRSRPPSLNIRVLPGSPQRHHVPGELGGGLHLALPLGAQAIRNQKARRR